MDDENSLELNLGLGLSCGGSSVKSKGSTSDPNGAEGSKGKATVGNLNVSEVSFDRFFPTSADNQDHVGQQRRENFWTSLGNQPAPEADGPTFRELWTSGNKATDVADEKAGLSKRKMPFEDTNLLKKPEIGGDLIDLCGKSTNNIALKSHVSINTEDGSSAENEDVAESEAEGPASWLMSRQDDHGKGSDAPRVSDKHFLSNSALLNSQGKNQPKSLINEANNQHGKFNYGVPFSVPPMPTTVSLPTDVPNTASVHNVTGFPSQSVMQLMPLADDNQSAVRSVNSSNLQLAFGYPSVQLPTLESGSSWMLGSRSQCVPSYDRKNTSDGVAKAAHSGDDLKASLAAAQASNNSVSASAFEGKILNLTKGNGKDTEEAVKHSTSQKEDEANGNKSIFRQNEISNQAIVEGLPEDSTIRPGVAPGLKFGGTGSCPDLPWVSTTGPNGKTISGVTYKYSKSQIRIVCACHGTHMSPEEFIQHASAEVLDAENNTGVASFPSSNAAASAQS